MDSWLPWLAMAGSGALHGLNPATGWLLAAAWGLRSGDRSHAVRALVPIAVGHGCAVVLVGAAVAFGASLDRALVQLLAATMLAAGLAAHWSGRRALLARLPAGHAGLALWSFLVAMAHGAGMMLVPALVPLCFGAALPAAGGTLPFAWAPLSMALAAVALHMAAMLVVTGAIASGICRGIMAGAQRWRAGRQR